MVPSSSSVGVTAVPPGGRRLPRGLSDNVSSGGPPRCSCDPNDGAVVLFYAYVHLSDPMGVVDRLRRACEAAGVTGKLRIAAEGINGTAAGSVAGVRALAVAMRNDPDPALAAAAASMDLKPSPGCSHAFDALSVRLVPEIVPFEGGRALERREEQRRRVGADGGIVVGGDGEREEDPAGPSDDAVPVGHVDPLEFHRAVEAANRECGAGDTVILDVRNWYESRVGHFEGAVLAPIRRFSQLPEYVASHPETFSGKHVLMYCTGGIRCEKAARFLSGATWSADPKSARPASVRQLRGGIVAYARDVLGIGAAPNVSPRLASCVDSPADQSATAPAGAAGDDAAVVAAGASKMSSMFKGCNFVFDNRGAVRVTETVTSWCDGCGAPSDRLSQCAAEGCHTILVVCASCRRTEGPREGQAAAGESTHDSSGDGEGDGKAGVFCCGVCRAQDEERRAGGGGKKRRRPCDCDSYAARERRLLPRPPA